MEGCSNPGRWPTGGGPLIGGSTLCGLDAFKAKLLARVWIRRLSKSWFCAKRNIDPWSVGIGPIPTFVESQRTALSWAFSSIKVCFSFISLFRGRINGGTVFMHRLMTQKLNSPGEKRGLTLVMLPLYCAHSKEPLLNLCRWLT